MYCIFLDEPQKFDSGYIFISVTKCGCCVLRWILSADSCAPESLACSGSSKEQREDGSTLIP